MKTNQIMIPNSLRKQRTKDGYLNASHLVGVWNTSNPNSLKDLAHYKLRGGTKDFIKQLQLEGIEKPMIITRGKNSGTWMHPKLFVDLAMWVSLEFKSMTLGWIVDGLIKTRHDAGDYYNEMCGTILEVYVDVRGRKPPADIYIKEAKFIKSLVSVKNRNLMTEEELRQITQLQKFNSNLIRKKMGRVAREKRLIEIAETFN